MGKKIGKLFIKYDESQKQIIPIEYNSNVDIDYYSFVKKNCSLGYNQIIITSEIMLELIKYYFLSRKFKIENIEFIEEDQELSDEMDYILNQLLIDRGYLSVLIEKLEFISDNSSIDIKRIQLSSGLNEENKFSLFIQVNGLCGIEEDFYDQEVNNIITEIKRCYPK